MVHTVVIDPPSKGESLENLRALRRRYEAHDRAEITDEALEAAVELSELYLQVQHLPRKAVRLIDEAGSRIRLMEFPPAPELRELDEQIDRTNQDKEEAIANQEFEQALALLYEATRLRKKQELMACEWRERSAELDGRVDTRVIEEVVSRPSRVPLETVRKRDSSSLARGMRPLRTSLPEFEQLRAESILRGEGVEIQQSTGLVLLPHLARSNDLLENVIQPGMSANGMVAKKADDI